MVVRASVRCGSPTTTGYVANTRKEHSCVLHNELTLVFGVPDAPSDAFTLPICRQRSWLDFAQHVQLWGAFLITYDSQGGCEHSDGFRQ